LSETRSPEPARDSDALVKAYNDVAYTSFTGAASHPDQLATIATLLGLDVAPVATCRVLEMACGDGMNLVPIAATLPNATFTGFDFAARPIARAQRMANQLGLSNIRLLQLDLREIPADLGSFDFVIAHGLYSWIPADVRARVMPLIAHHLAPNGVAFVSYNTLPGCHMRRAVWEMLKYHTREITDLPAKLAAARSLIALASVPVKGEHESEKAMRAELRHSGEINDASLAHDDMSEPNDPVYFHEFVADAARAGLTFLAEARLGTMMGPGLAPSVRQELGKLDRLVREQYLDFIYFRRYRESLLCHRDALSRFVVQPARTLQMYATPSSAFRNANATPAPETDADARALEKFLLARWPNSVPVPEVAEWHRRALPADASERTLRPIEMLLAELYVAGRVDLRTLPVAAAATAGANPEAFAPARWISHEHDVVPNLYQEPLRLHEPVVRKLLGFLDGTRTHDELMAAVGAPLSGPNGRGQLDKVLAMLAREALLVR
jgi:SAM-dependent methyltransferase